MKGHLTGVDFAVKAHSEKSKPERLAQVAEKENNLKNKFSRT